MRTIYGNLKIDNTTYPNPTLVIEHGNIFPIGMTMEHFGERDPYKMVFTHGRSGRVFFQESNVLGNMPSRQIIVPASTKIAKDVQFSVIPTDNEDYLILDFCSGTIPPFVAMFNDTICPSGIVVWSFDFDRRLAFESIDEYDVYISSQPAESDLSGAPAPIWVQNCGYDFLKGSFVDINILHPIAT